MRGRCRVVGEDFSRLSLSPGEQKAVSVVEAESAAAAALAPVVDSRSVAGLAGYDEGQCLATMPFSVNPGVQLPPNTRVLLLSRAGLDLTWLLS